MREKKQRYNGKCVWLLAVLMVVLTWCIGAPQAVHADAKAYDLLVPCYNTAYLTDAEVNEMPLQVLCYAKNEIYAQHGRKFLSKELAEYFEEQPWYYGSVSGSDFSEAVFNDYEKENIAKLSAREKELRDGGYLLDQAGYSFQPIYDYINQRDGILTGIAAGFDFNETTNTVSTACFSFEIPKEWDGKWTYTAHSSDSIAFCCGPVKANSEMDGGLCTILRMDTYESDDYFPAADYLGTSGGYYYYLLYPTDVRFDEAHADIYRTMEAGVERIPASFQLK